MKNPILEKRKLVQDRIEKSFDSGINVPEEVEIEKAHQDGEIHPNGKWVWVSSANGGKGDWRTRGGRTHNAHTDKEKQFKQNFKNAQDGILQKIIDGKIQAGAHEKKWAQDILDERKKGSAGDKAAAKIIDLMKISNSKYSDISKVVAFKTDKGNWAMDYDGANTGLIIGKDHLSEAELKAAGVKIEGANANKKTDDTKPKADPKQDKAAQAAGFKDYEEMKGWQDYTTAKNLLKKPSMKLKSKESDRKELEKQVADYEKDHADVIAARGGKKKTESYASMDIKDAKKALVGKVVTLSDYWGDGRGGSQDAIGEIKNVRLYGKNKTPIAEVVYPNGDEQQIRLDEIDDGKMKDSYKTPVTISDDKTKLDAIKNKIAGNSAKEKIASMEKTETKKTNDGNFKGMKFTEILDSLDEWEDDDWNNQELNEKLTEAIKGAIKKEGIDEKKFKEIAKKYQGLDLVYEDYTGDPEGDFAKLLNPLDDWSDDDWNDDKKNKKLSSDIKGLIMKHKMSESDFRKMAKKYQGLDLVYTDYVPKNSDLYKKYNGKA